LLCEIAVLIFSSACDNKQAESNPECRDVMSMCDNLLHTEEQLAKVMITFITS